LFYNSRTMEDLGHPSLDQINLDEVFCALGDSKRLAIVRRLLDAGELSCKCLCGDNSKSTLSHHFRVLRNSGITRTRICGTHRWISVREKELENRFPGLLELVRERDMARSIGLEPTTLSSAS
jgi:DNA-binding transcriptional ArsR family regulator